MGFDLGEVAAAIATGDLSHKGKTMSSTQSLAPNHGSVLDKTWERHCENGLTRARPVGPPFLEKAALGGLRFRALQRVEEISRALRMGGGSEDHTVVVLQSGNPGTNVGCVIVPDLRHEFQIGAKESGG